MSSTKAIAPPKFIGIMRGQGLTFVQIRRARREYLHMLKAGEVTIDWDTDHVDRMRCVCALCDSGLASIHEAWPIWTFKPATPARATTP